MNDQETAKAVAETALLIPPRPTTAEILDILNIAYCKGYIAGTHDMGESTKRIMNEVFPHANP